MSVEASGQEMGFIERQRCAPPRLKNRRQGEHLANHHHRWSLEGSRPSSFPHFDSRSSFFSRGNPWWRRDPSRISPYSRSARHDCLYSRAERRKQTTCLTSRERDQGSCPPLPPSFGSSKPSYFGSGFCKELDEESIGQGSTLGFECIDDGSGPPADRAPKVSRAYAGSRALKRSEVEKESSCLTPSRDRIPTLVEMHKAVIDSTLQEFFRPREGPFENLGERLGGGRENFTYCDRSIRMPRGSHSFAFGEIEQCPLFHQMNKTGRGDDATSSEGSTCEKNADRERRRFRCIHRGRSKSSKPRGLLSGPQQMKRSQVVTDGCSGAKQTECDADEFESREEFSQGESHQAEQQQQQQQPTLPQADTCHTTQSAVHCTTSRKVQERCDASELELSSNKPRQLRTTAVRCSETASHFCPHVDSPLPNERIIQNPPRTYMRPQIIYTASTAGRRTKKQSSGRADTKAPSQPKSRASIASRKGPHSTSPRRHGGDDHARLVGKRSTGPRSTRDSRPPSLKLPIDLDRNNNGAVVLGEAADGESSSEPKSGTKKTIGVDEGVRNGVDEGVRKEVDRDAAAIELITEKTLLAATSRAIVEGCVGRVLSCSASWSRPMMTFRSSMKQDCTTACSAGRGVAASSPMTTSASCFIGGSTVRVLEVSNPSSVVDGESLPAHVERTVSPPVSSGLLFVAEEPLGSGPSLALSATTVTAASKGPLATSLSAAPLPGHFESKNDVLRRNATRVVEESIQRAIALAVKE